LSTTAVDCDKEVTFEARILIGMIGRPDDVTSAEISLLENAFVDAYANAECGDRDIDDVTIATDMNTDGSRSRVLQTSSNNRDFTYIFQASGRCRGCQPNSRLFGEAVNLRDLQAAVNSDSEEDESCPCEAPSDDDFLLSFNSTIQGLRSDGLLANIVGVNSVAELEELECPSEESFFETSASITFEGDTGTEPSQSELEALASTFVDAYNEANLLNGETCDLLFRVASEASLIRTEASSENRTRGLQSSQQYNYQVRVRGSCRGCGRNTRLFGESQGRKLGKSSTLSGALPEFTPHEDYHRMLQGSSCFCPVDNPELRASTENEFQDIYNEQVDYLRGEGEVTSVSSVVAVSDMNVTGPPEDLCANVTCDNPIDGCDPFDGICKPKDAAVPCIAIIDESSQSDSYIESQWAEFRTEYPDRPFCLLQPLNSASSRLYIPPSFLSDFRTTFAQVSRDNLGASSEIQPSPSDWFNICGFGVYEGSDIDFIGKFLDTSGSMSLSTVQASNDLFDENVNSTGLTIQEVFNGIEDWITPFLTTLVPEP
jgi:hypothetical protein